MIIIPAIVKFVAYALQMFAKGNTSIR